LGVYLKREAAETIKFCSNIWLERQNKQYYCCVISDKTGNGNSNRWGFYVVGHPTETVVYPIKHAKGTVLFVGLYQNRQAMQTVIFKGKSFRKSNRKGFILGYNCWEI